MLELTDLVQNMNEGVAAKATRKKTDITKTTKPHYPTMAVRCLCLIGSLLF